MSNQCKHGQLARVCDVCELEQELADTKVQLETAEQRGYDKCLQELSEQEPVATVYGVAVDPDSDGLYTAKVHSKERLSLNAELFVKPLPPTKKGI